MKFFDGKEEILPANYTILENEGVKVGDIVYKEKCSEYLYIYREDHREKYIYLKVQPSGLFPYEYFCK